MQRTSHWHAERIALLLLVLIAAALRLYRLDAQDIWGDEAFSIFLSQQPLQVVIAGASDTHPPFYPLLLFFWLQLVGSSAVATRALSALIGILAVPLIFVLAKRLTTRPRVSWLAAVLATISPLMIYYSQETRMYELVAVLALASVYCLTSLPLRPLSPLLTGTSSGEGREGWGRGVRYYLITLLALYTHYSAFFVLAAENIFALIRLRKDRSALLRWIALQVLLGVAYIPWIVVQTSFLRGKASGRFDEWGWRGIEMIFGKTFLSFSIGLTVDAPLMQVSAALFVALAVLGLYTIWKIKPVRFETLAPIYFIVPIVIAYVVNPVMPFFYERYVLVALPGFILMVAFGLDYIIALDRRAAIGIGGVVLLLNLFANYNLYFDDAYAKGKYGQMMAYILENAQPGDALILNNPLQKPLYQYYAPRNIPAYFLPDGDISLEDASMKKQLDDVAKKSPRMWLVMFGNPAEYDPTGYLERWFGAHAFKTYANGFVDAALSLYVMPSAQPSIRRSLRATLGESIQLMGYDLDRDQVAPGQALQLTLHWKTSKSIEKRYTVFAHVIGGVNPATKMPVWAQMDTEPVGGSRPTMSWQAGETIDDRYGLLLPANIPPGEYLIEVGMYDSATQERLPVFDEKGERVQDDRIILGSAQVVAR